MKQNRRFGKTTVTPVLLILMPQMDFDSTAMDTSTNSRGQILGRWILHFVMIMQARFKLPYAVLEYILPFFGAMFTIIGQSSEVARDVSAYLPRSMHKARKIVGDAVFTRYVVCRECLSLYTISDSIEHSGTINKSKQCSFCRFPPHPHLSMRSPCGTLLLKTVELAS